MLVIESLLLREPDMMTLGAGKYHYKYIQVYGKKGKAWREDFEKLKFLNETGWRKQRTENTR